MIAAVLGFESVTYRYPAERRPALDDVSIAVKPGEFVVVAGLSGSGKSTFLRAACGLAPRFHGGEWSGTVTATGLDTREHGPGDLAASVGTLFQDPETQVVMGTPRAEIAFGLENRGLPPAAVARGVEEAALALGVGGLLDRPVHELSGGELQRVALGAALAGRPQLVLLDEPTSQLDPVAGDELVWLLRRLNEEWGTAIIVAEHRLERCLAAADRVVAFDAGAIACDAAPREFLTWAARESPALETPAAELLARAGLRPPPVGVKDARATLRANGLEPEPADRADAPHEVHPNRRRPSRSRRGRGAAPPAALRFDDVWHEIKNGPAILRGVSLAFEPGERVALMGRNGAGKSTLLRHAAGLMEPTRGRIATAGRVALLLQNPTDYLVHDRVDDEAPRAVLHEAGLAELAGRHPRDLSGGERQRLALAVVLGGSETPAVVCLDEPTRGMDRAHKGILTSRVRELADRGAAVLVATHDAELAAALADRVVLLGDGRVIADAPTAQVLAGGWYFATETARVLSGAGGALLPEEGAELLRRELLVECASRKAGERAKRAVSVTHVRGIEQ